ncbi:unnamed protein product [Pedinophyceae sp. YPF-701]|nr:unnamed protein product [Pedinophyceae sp. YPF-701]
MGVDEVIEALGAGVSRVHELLCGEGATDLADVIRSCPRGSRARLHAAVLAAVDTCAGFLNADGAARAGNAATPGKGASGPDSLNAEESLCSLAAALRALATNAASDIKGAVDLQNAAERIHDSCICEAQGRPALQDAACAMAEAWWRKSVEGADRVIAQTLLHLLMTALLSGRAGDVKRCAAIRTALNELDYDDAASDFIKQLLLRATMHPAFLRSPDGRRLVAHALTLHAPLVPEMFAVIRNQAVTGRKSVLDAYGEVLYRGWKAAAGACRAEIEAGLAGVAESALLARTPALAVAAGRLLTHLLDNRVAPGAEALVARIHLPLVFRYLTAANAQVRCNAVRVLGAVFPLQDPEAPQEENDELLARQVGRLGKALADPCAHVRAEGVRATGRVLNLYWELLPAGTCAALLKRVVEELAVDASTPDVRAAVVETASVLVGNPQTHAVLLPLLPRLGPLINDPSPRVRLHLATLLCDLNRTRGARFTDVVDVEALLETISRDAGVSGAAVQRLLLPSFWPSADEGPALVVGLLRHAPAAGVAFCRYLAARLTPGPQTTAATKKKGRKGASANTVTVADAFVLAEAMKEHLLAVPLEAAPAEAERPRRGKKGSKKRAVAEDAETPETWTSIAAGLAEVCAGLAERAADAGAAAADGGGQAGRGGSRRRGAAGLDTIFESDEVPEHAPSRLFEDGSLTELLAAAPPAAARAAVLAVAATLDVGSAGAVGAREACMSWLDGAAGRRKEFLGSEALLTAALRVLARDEVSRAKLAGWIEHGLAAGGKQGECAVAAAIVAAREECVREALGPRALGRLSAAAAGADGNAVLQMASVVLATHAAAGGNASWLPEALAASACVAEAQVRGLAVAGAAGRKRGREEPAPTDAATAAACADVGLGSVADGFALGVLPAGGTARALEQWLEVGGEFCTMADAGTSEDAAAWGRALAQILRAAAGAAGAVAASLPGAEGPLEGQMADVADNGDVQLKDLEGAVLRVATAAFRAGRESETASAAVLAALPGALSGLLKLRGAAGAGGSAWVSEVARGEAQLAAAACNAAKLARVAPRLAEEAAAAGAAVAVSAAVLTSEDASTIEALLRMCKKLGYKHGSRGSDAAVKQHVEAITRVAEGCQGEARDAWAAVLDSTLGVSLAPATAAA